MKKNPQKRQKKAFALVLALALMGFIVLLTVSLATMVGMQVKLSKQSLNAFKAKQAAKFSAYQALGQIQSTLGPDQRITANAGMLSTSINGSIIGLDTDSTFNWWSSPMNIKRAEAETVGGAMSKNKYWVGVWHSKHGYHPEKQLRTENRASYIQNVRERAITWLVSGNGFASPDEVRSGSNSGKVIYQPDALLNPQNAVRVVSKNSYISISGSESHEDDVYAPIVLLENDEDNYVERNQATQTRIAWWVADEGQKASLNAIASYDMIKHAETIKHRVQSMPFYSGIQGLTKGDSNAKIYNVSLDDDGMGGSSMMVARSASALDQLDAISANDIDVPSKLLFHAATCNTRGLLVNVRDGGLKKDLSLGLLQIDGKDDAHATTTENEIKSIPEYFPRPYGVSGFYNKTTAYPIRWLTDHSDWRNNRRKYKPQLDEEKYIGTRQFAGHIFGPQMFTREDEVKKYEKQSFGKSCADNDWNDIYYDTMLWKDPGGALWDQLRSYYNLRSPDKPSASNISARVQTDDRYGAKPVVKRFQVHYVPAFVDYGSQQYGLRLHIIPMLVLWNPYDTKIGEDTYYVIRVSARDFKELHNPIGSFRFAIGYQSSGYFQCLRDLYTEKMKFPTTSEASNPRFMMQNCVTLTHQGRYNTTGSYTYPQYYDLYNSIYPDNPTQYGYRMSQSIPFYTQRYLPLGYNGIANFYIKKVVNSQYNPGLSTNKLSNIFQVITAGNSRTWQCGDLDDWASVVQEDNMYPSAAQMGQWISPYSGRSSKSYTGVPFNLSRVAKIPLFLNNLYANLSHGSVYSKRTSNYDVFFFGQRGIDAVNTNEKTISNLYSSNYWQTPDLHFMVYDKTGIDAGATKVYAMGKPINYLGDFRGSTHSGKNGPNGIIEAYDYMGGKTSPYETLNALMKPIGEGGNLGGCFYVDVPHPELEHYAKYVNSGTDNPDNPPKPETRADFDIKNPYVLFNMNDIRNAHHVDIHGKSSSSLSINDIIVDMEDTCVFPNIDINGSRITPYQRTISMTPMAYGLSRYNTNYITVDGNAVDTYQELMVSIWIYKKEGMTFTKMRAREPSGSTFTGDYPDYVPLLAFFKGRRNFLGARFPSFPNPAMTYADTTSSERDMRYNNWHTPGYISKNSGGGGGTNRGNLISLTPAVSNYYQTLDNYVNSRKNMIVNAYTTLDAEKWNASKWTLAADMIETNKARTAFNGRFFYNWLPLNPRRHSANTWKLLPSNMKNEIGDLLPAARQLAPRMMLTASEINSNSYGSKLHNYCQANNEYIPYAYIFGIPYADDDDISESGAKPIHNRRLYVNGTLLANYYNSDYNAQEVSDNASDLRNRQWGLASKQVIATSLIYYNKTDGMRTPYSGLTQMGYKIPSSNDFTAFIGLSQKSGTDVNALHHILRENEVVHNIANLAGASLNFGAGKWDATSDWTNQGPPFPMQKDSQRPWTYAYGLFSPESLMAGLAIGNSLCPSRICPEYTYQILWLDGSSTVNNYPHRQCRGKGEKPGQREHFEEKSAVYDLSWHLNDALWDEYFFSTLPYRLKEESLNFNEAGGYAVPQNPRIRYVSTDRGKTLELAEMKYSADESDKQFEENAGKLWVNGPFNVNSTSVDAWKAILSTYYGQRIEGYKEGVSDNRASAPFHRWAAPLDGSKKATSSTNITSEETLFTGYRALSDSEIEELAVSIVEHIKDRGPFYSMSDFVNRLAANYSAEEKYAYKSASEEDLLSLSNQTSRIRENDIASLMKTGGETYRVGHTQKGVLQAAIDATSINKAFHNRYVIGQDINSLNTSWEDDNVFKFFKDEKKVWENWRAVVGPAATGAPAYLMQQDILSRLGSFLTVRSDTFKIRAYGEVRNPVSGVVESKAWCEMVVQRMPEYVDDSSMGNEPADIYGREKELGYQPDLAEYNTIMNESNGGLTKLNQALGRKFKVVSFRWLGDNEI